jgi:hypothetical protein
MFGCGGHVSIYSIAKVKSGEVAVVIFFGGRASQRRRVAV